MPNIFYISYGVMWVLLIFQGILVLLIYRHFGLMALGTVEGIQRDGIPVGDVAPVIEGITIQGESIQWTPKTGQTKLLAFVSPECKPCANILPSIHRLATESDDVEVALVVAGSPEMLVQLVNKFHPPSSVVFFADAGKGAYRRYRVRVTPFAFIINQDGHVLAKGLCSDQGKLRELLATAALEVPKFLEAGVQWLGKVSQ